MVATEQRRFGLPDETISDLQRVFSQNAHVERVLLFGSRAMGTYKNGSDIDLALFGTYLTYDDLIDLRTRLDALPYAYTYDLVDYARSTNPALKAHIDDLGLPFYEQQRTQLPAGWREYTLGEITVWRSGGTPSKDIESYWNGTIPWISAKTFPDVNVYDSPIKITEAGLKSGSRLAKVDSLLLLVRGSGLFNDIPIAIVRKSVAFNQDVKSIEVNEQIIKPEFLLYWLKGIKNRLNDILEHTGIGAGKLDLKVLQSLPIQVPPMDVQDNIIACISALDNKIELNRQMNQTLESIAQTLFTELTTSEERMPLGEYIEFNPKISIRKDSIVKYVEMRDLPESEYSIQGYVNRPFNAGSKFQQHDTLLARITPCLENGKTGFVDFLNQNEAAFGSTEFIVMRPKTGISPYYVCLLARTNDFRGYAIKSMIGTSGRQRVQTDVLLNFETSKIDIEKMVDFHDNTKALFEKIRLNSLENQTLTQLRDNLLPRLLSGKIAVESNDRSQ